MQKLEVKYKDKENNKGKNLEEDLSRFGPSFFFKGELSGDESLIIEGQFQGKIDVHNNSLVVEQGAKVEADIWANDIIIKGGVKGNIFASGKVFIESRAQMNGDISARRISISDGAQFKGSVKMRSAIQELSNLTLQKK